MKLGTVRISRGADDSQVLTKLSEAGSESEVSAFSGGNKKAPRHRMPYRASRHSLWQQTGLCLAGGSAHAVGKRTRRKGSCKP